MGAVRARRAGGIAARVVDHDREVFLRLKCNRPVFLVSL